MSTIIMLGPVRAFVHHLLSLLVHSQVLISSRNTIKPPSNGEGPPSTLFCVYALYVRARPSRGLFLFSRDYSLFQR